MKIKASLMAMSVLAVAALPLASNAQERYNPRGEAASNVLSQSEIDDLIAQARNSGVAISGASDVRYVGANPNAVETVQCCENVEERVEERTEYQETEVAVPAVTARDVIQPVQRTLIQPIERRVLQPTSETVTEDMRYEENRLPVRIERDPVPAVVENTIPQETTETREEVTESTYDVLGHREIIQPVERTVVVPVQRRITRPRVETVTAETRYETRKAPVQVQAAAIPAVAETMIPQVTEETRQEITEVAVPYVATRDVIQPVTRTAIQPVERQILRGTTETVTAATQYVEERLPVRVETQPAPAVTENTTEQLTERTVLEVEDVYIDQVTRNVIQPVVITTIQPIERQVIAAQKETVTNPVQYEEQRLAGIVEDVMVPETQVNYVAQVTEESREEYSESYFEAVTQRDIIQPIVRTLIQPVEIRRPRVTTETVTAPTRYETVRASLVVLNIGGSCVCSDGTIETKVENCD
ncbi:MAG: hypothetical protein R3C13_05735 [Hyphomonas sp.]|uniref:hypothetical protein n=1 Tax=Hyphomonas sp. TaxID=87 RepID=UPI003528E34D